MLALLTAVAVAQSLPAFDQPVRTGAHASADTAVIVGIEAYTHIANVPYAVRDARAFYDLMLYTRGIPADRLYLLEGGAKEQIVAAVRAAAAQAGPDGAVWFYFAGHGAASLENSERMLLGDDVRTDPIMFQARAVSVAEIERLATERGSRALMILDTCYAGAGRDGNTLLPNARFAVPTYATQGSPQAAVWTAAGPNELSGPLESVQHGAFTYFVVGALRGWADGELDGQPDGVVTAAEARTYVHRALRSVQKRSQQPAWTGASGDDLVLSRGREAAPALSATVPAAPMPQPTAAPPSQPPAPSRPAPQPSAPIRQEPQPERVSEAPDGRMQSKGRPLPELVEELPGTDTPSSSGSRPYHNSYEANKRWPEVHALALGGTADGRRALEDFVATYGEGGTKPDGSTIWSSPVVVEMADQWLSRYDRVGEKKAARRYESASGWNGPLEWSDISVGRSYPWVTALAGAAMSGDGTGLGNLELGLNLSPHYSWYSGLATRLELGADGLRPWGSGHFGLFFEKTYLSVLAGFGASPPLGGDPAGLQQLLQAQFMSNDGGFGPLGGVRLETRQMLGEGAGTEVLGGAFIGLRLGKPGK